MCLKFNICYVMKTRHDNFILGMDNVLKGRLKFIKLWPFYFYLAFQTKLSLV